VVAGLGMLDLVALGEDLVALLFGPAADTH
jgi:hypothetical protein